MSTAALGVPLAPEEQARAGVYALLARLYGGAPDAGLLALLGSAERLPEDGADFPVALNRLMEASTVMDADAATQEYTDLFVGVGKAEVVPTASHWMVGHSHDRPLAALRTELAGLGLARRAGAVWTEDHLSALLETMRLLVAGEPQREPASVAVQRAFFERWLDSWAPRCCAAIADCSIANYYRRVAECTKMFLAIERDSFAID